MILMIVMMMMTRLYYFLRYGLIFLRELVLANYQVARLVLSPSPRIRPGFLAIHMEAKSDFEITSLANSITLTPGTISVHVSDGRDVIIIHALDISDDPDKLRAQIKRDLEANILKWTRSSPPHDTPPASTSTGPRP